MFIENNISFYKIFSRVLSSSITSSVICPLSSLLSVVAHLLLYIFLFCESSILFAAINASLIYYIVICFLTDQILIAAEARGELKELCHEDR